MIHPAALPALPGLPMPGEAVPVQAAAGLELADFGALLAIESQGLGLVVQASKLPLATPAPLADAAILPESGNALPLALPVAVSEETIGEVSDPVVAVPAVRAEHGEREAPLQADPLVPALPSQLVEPVPVLAAPVATAPAEGPVAVYAQPPSLPIPAPNPILLRQIPALPNTGNRAPPVPSTQAERGEQRQIAPSVAQPATTPIILSVAAVPIVAAARIGEPQQSLSSPIAGAAPVPDPVDPPVIGPRLRLALAVTAERRPGPGKAAPITLPDLALPMAEPIAPTAAIAAAAVPALFAPAAFAPADPALRPHDFTQLVDRLVAARELAAPQSFQLALQHGEFGQVQLRFSREGEGLNITMASADPEFARVVSAAPPPVLAPLPTETATPGGQRFEGQPQAGASNGNPAQHRGASPERREDRHGPEGNPAPARHTEPRGSRRSGIFA